MEFGYCFNFRIILLVIFVYLKAYIDDKFCARVNGNTPKNVVIPKGFIINRLLFQQAEKDSTVTTF